MLIVMYLPNLEELSLAIVFALPKASKIGLQAKIRSSIFIYFLLLSDSEILAMNFIIIFVFSVLPDPLFHLQKIITSPFMIID